MRLPAVLSRFVLPVPLAAAVFVAWATGVDWLFDSTSLRHFVEVGSIVVALPVVALLHQVGARNPGLRRPVTLLLLSSVILLPFLHAPLLLWFSDLLAGRWGDCFCVLGPFELFGLEPLLLPYRWRTDLWAVVTLALLLVAHAALLPVAIALGRLRARRAVAVALSGVAVVASVAVVHTFTRPDHARWVDALPVHATIAVDRIPYTAWTDDGPLPGATLAPGIVVTRDRGGLVLGYGGQSDLPCARGSTLRLQMMPGPIPRPLLSCDLSTRDGVGTMAADTPWKHVYRFEALDLSAPPLAWIGFALLGLVGAAVLLREPRRSATRSAHPYRERFADDAPVDADDGRAALQRAAALAVAVHAAAPLILLPWTMAVLR